MRKYCKKKGGNFWNRVFLCKQEKLHLNQNGNTLQALKVRVVLQGLIHSRGKESC